MVSETDFSRQPVGVFDSGVGGLSVLRELLHVLPQEDMVSLADTAWAPYGERSTDEIQSRSFAIADYLVERYHIKALVVACNTATAQAAQELRLRYPTLPLIGIEPAIKPAAALTRTGHIGIMATHGTVASSKFQQLLHTWRGEHDVRVQACNGLALAIENALDGPAGLALVQQLCATYVQALEPFVGQDPVQGIDTLALGCTHYPFAARTLQKLVGPDVTLIDPGESVALQTRRLLEKTRLTLPEPDSGHQRQLSWLCTAAPERLALAADKWLGIHEARVEQVQF